MNIWEYNRSAPPSITELESVGDFLLKEFSKYLKLKLKFFKTDITEKESFVGTFHNITPIIKPLSIKMEGVILYQIRDKIPAINAELLLFGKKERMGLSKHSGKSLLLFNYSKKSKWYIGTWLLDDVDDWEKIEYTRENEYSKIKKTINE